MMMVTLMTDELKIMAAMIGAFPQKPESTVKGQSCSL